MLRRLWLVIYVFLMVYTHFRLRKSKFCDIFFCTRCFIANSIFFQFYVAFYPKKWLSNFSHVWLKISYLGLCAQKKVEKLQAAPSSLFSRLLQLFFSLLKRSLCPSKNIKLKWCYLCNGGVCAVEAFECDWKCFVSKLQIARFRERVSL